MMPAGLTHSEVVDELIAQYHGHQPLGILENETDQLLAALLMELQAQRVSGGGGEAADVLLEQYRQERDASETHGTYHSEAVEAAAGEWYGINLDFVTSEVDLRNIGGAVDVAFADPTGDHNVVRYDDTDSPVAGIAIETGAMWFKSPSGSVTLNVEAWE